MPLTVVQRRAPAGGMSADPGVQKINGTLTLPNTGALPAIVEFDAELWKTASAGTRYPLFDYSGTGALSPSTLAKGTITNLAADSASLTALSFTSATFYLDTAAKIIYVTFTA